MEILNMAAEGHDAAHQKEAEEEALDAGIIIIFLMLVFFMTSGALIERYHMKFGHEASYTVLMGMLVSFYEFEHHAK